MTHLNRVTCCDHTFTPKDIRGRLVQQRRALGTNDQKLYGGRAQWFAQAACPACGKQYVLWLEPIAHGYRVLTISEAGDKQKEPEFDVSTATRDELRSWLKQRGISFFNGASEEQLRGLVLETMGVS